MKDQRSDQELNRIIAEWYRSDIPDSGVSVAEFGESPPFYPPYCTDLNAIHEAEKQLSSLQCTMMHDILRNQYCPGPEMASHWHWHATARQRAEALVSIIESQ